MTTAANACAQLEVLWGLACTGAHLKAVTSTGSTLGEGVRQDVYIVSAPPFNQVSDVYLFHSLEFLKTASLKDFRSA